MRSLSLIAQGDGPIDPGVLHETRAHAFAYEELLQRHVMKENDVLYPMAIRVLSPESVRSLDEAARAFDLEKAAPKAELFAWARDLGDAARASRDARVGSLWEGAT